MDITKQIEKYISTHPEPKCHDMLVLHQSILQIRPNCKLWFLDGRDASGKIVSNPNIGYGSYTIKYADGKTKEFYQVGLSANSTGISVYIMGIDDKTYLSKTFGSTIGKAGITGYCIKFKSLKDINLNVLEDALKFGFKDK